MSVWCATSIAAVPQSWFVRGLGRVVSFPFRMLDGLFGSRATPVPDAPIDPTAAQAARRRAADAE